MYSEEIVLNFLPFEFFKRDYNFAFVFVKSEGISSPSCLHYHKNNVNIFRLNTTSFIRNIITSSYMFRLAR